MLDKKKTLQISCRMIASAKLRYSTSVGDRETVGCFFELNLKEVEELQRGGNQRAREKNLKGFDMKQNEGFPNCRSLGVLKCAKRPKRKKNTSEALSAFLNHVY